MYKRQVSIDLEATELSPFENYDPSWGIILVSIHRQDDPSLSINGVDSGLKATFLIDFALSGPTLLCTPLVDLLLVHQIARWHTASAFLMKPQSTRDEEYRSE